jgi:hypothetical protein
MPNSSRRDTVELKRPRARLNFLLLIPAVAVLSAAGIFANPGSVVSMSSTASRPARVANLEPEKISFDESNNFNTASNDTRAKHRPERTKAAKDSSLN